MLFTANERLGERLIGSGKSMTVDAELMLQLDRIHAQLGEGFATPEALSCYLDFLEAIPRGVSVGARVTVALALVDTILAMDELKLEKRKLRSTLDPVESATYDILVRIGQHHAQIITHGTASAVVKRHQQGSTEQVF